MRKNTIDVLGRPEWIVDVLGNFNNELKPYQRVTVRPDVMKAGTGIHLSAIHGASGNHPLSENVTVRPSDKKTNVYLNREAALELVQAIVLALVEEQGDA